MLKFKGSRKLEEVIEKAKDKGYTYYEEDHQQRFKKRDIDICLRSFGKFFVYDEDGICIATEKSDEFDGEEWLYDENISKKKSYIYLTMLIIGIVIILVGLSLSWLLY